MLLPLIAVACYLFAALGLGMAAYRGDSHHGRGRRIASVAIAVVGAAVHVAALLDERRLDPQAALSLGDTAAIVSLVPTANLNGHDTYAHSAASCFGGRYMADITKETAEAVSWILRA